MLEINVILKLLICVALIGAGIAFAENLWGLPSKLGYWSLRNPVTIMFTTFALEWFPKTLFQFEQDCLRHFNLAPYFLIAGAVAGFALSSRNFVLGAFFSLSYAIWFYAEVIQMAPQFESEFQLHWSMFFPHFVWDLALTPVYLIGAACGSLLRLRVRPRRQLYDLLIGTAILAGFMMCIRTRAYLAIPIGVFIVCSFAAYVVWKAIPAAELEAPSQPAGT